MRGRSWRTARSRSSRCATCRASATWRSTWRPFSRNGPKTGVFEGAATREDPPAAIDPEGPAKRRAANRAVECINCAVCYAACDVAAWDPGYLGPAALNRAWSIVNDDRAANAGAVRARARAAGGCGSPCHTHGACAAACPVGLSPTRSIAGLKRFTLADLI